MDVPSSEEIIALLQEISNEQKVLKGEELYAKTLLFGASATKLTELITRAKMLFINMKKYYSNILTIYLKEFDKGLKFEKSIKSMAQYQLSPESEVKSRNIPDYNQFTKCVLDAFGNDYCFLLAKYSVIPAMFGYFISADFVENYIAFMNKIHDNFDIFGHCAKSAMISPLVVSFVKRVFNPLIQKIEETNNFEKPTKKDFIEAWKENAKFCPDVLRKLVNLDQRIIEDLLIEMQNHPNIYWLTEAHDHSVISENVKNIFNELIDSYSELANLLITSPTNAVTQYPQLGNDLNKSIHAIFLFNSFDDMFFKYFNDNFEFQKFQKFKIPEVYNIEFCKRKDTNINPTPILSNQTFMPDSSIGISKLADVFRTFLKHAPCLPNYTQFCEGFSLQTLVQEAILYTSGNRQSAVIAAASAVMSDPTFLEHCDLASRSDIDIFRMALSMMHFRHTEAERDLAASQRFARVDTVINELSASVISNSDVLRNECFVYPIIKDFEITSKDIMVKDPNSLFREYSEKTPSPATALYKTASNSIPGEDVNELVMHHLLADSKYFNRDDIESFEKIIHNCMCVKKNRDEVIRRATSTLKEGEWDRVRPFLGKEIKEMRDILKYHYEIIQRIKEFEEVKERAFRIVKRESIDINSDNKIGIIVAMLAVANPQNGVLSFLVQYADLVTNRNSTIDVFEGSPEQPLAMYMSECCDIAKKEFNVIDFTSSFNRYLDVYVFGSSTSYAANFVASLLKIPTEHIRSSTAPLQKVLNVTVEASDGDDVYKELVRYIFLLHFTDSEKEIKVARKSGAPCIFFAGSNEEEANTVFRIAKDDVVYCEPSDDAVSKGSLKGGFWKKPQKPQKLPEDEAQYEQILDEIAKKSTTWRERH